LFTLVVVLGVVAWTYIDDRNDASRANERREQEWRHGGDSVVASATIKAFQGPAFERAYRAAGGSGRLIAKNVHQGYVVRLTVGEVPRPDDTYRIVLIDGRAKPQPRPFLSAQAWRWQAAHAALADHYPWLGSTAAEALAPGTTVAPVKVVLPQLGIATYGFYSDADEGGISTDHPARDLRMALFAVDSHGEVRWAREVPLLAG